jgi:hypothetical protein
MNRTSRHFGGTLPKRVTVQGDAHRPGLPHKRTATADAEHHRPDAGHPARGHWLQTAEMTGS